MRKAGWPVTLGTIALALCGCRRSTAMEAPSASPPAPRPDAPQVDALKATVKGLYADWAAGRIEAAFNGFAKTFRERSSPAATAASLRTAREAMGEYVGLEGGELRPAGIAADGRPVTVLGVTVRYQRGSQAADFAFVHQDGAWRLAAWGPRTPVPDDATAKSAARALMDGVARGGAMTLMTRFTASTRAQAGEAGLVRSLGHVAAVLGGLRRYELGEPVFASLTCRDLKGTAEFEHGRARINLQVCRESDAWMLQSFDAFPEEVAGGYFERAIAYELEAAGQGGATVRCPDGPVAVGAEVACRVARGGERIVMRVRRTGETQMAVVGATPE